MQATTDLQHAPGRKWYAIAFAAFLAGMVAFGIFLALQLTRIDANFTRMAAPGVAEMDLAVGEHTIFRETGGAADGRVLSSGDIGGMRISVQRPGGGAQIVLTPNATSRYSVGARSGQSLFTFTIVEAGRYRIVAAYDDGRTTPQAVLAIGQGFAGGLLMTIFSSLAIAFGGAIAAAVIAISVFRRRRRAGYSF